MTVQPQDSGELGFANRAADLLQNNAWLDSPTAIAVAQQTGNSQQAQDQATLLGQALAQSWDGYEQRFYDPILQAQPSTSYAVSQHIAATVGPAPATDGIVTLQKALQADGFLKSEPNGVWDRQTEDAYNQAVSALREQQYAGAPKKGGNPFTSTTSRLFHAVVHDVTHPWDAAVGWYDSATQAAGYFGGWLATGAGTLGTATTQAHLSGNITRALGHHVSDEQAAQAYEGSIGHRIENAAGNAVSLAVTAGAAKAVGKAALQAGKAAIEGGVSEADLTKLQKVGLAMGAAQRLGFVGRSVADIGDALRAGTLPASAPEVQRSLGVVSKTLLRAPLKLTGSADRLPNLVSKEWRDAVPGLARLAPVAEQIASGAEQGGWAYKVRNLMAQPYRLAPVRAAGIATQRAQIGALAAHAGANLLPGSTLSQDVSGARTGLDSWLDNTTWNALPGVSISPDMLLLGPLHGDLVGAGRASAVIGATVHGWQNKVASALGDLGVEAAFQSILGMDRAELVDMAGSEGNLRLWINDKVNQYASDTYTQRQMAESDFTHTFTGGDAAFEDAAKAHRDAWYAMPQAQRAQWVADTATADSHFSWIRNRLQADVLRGAVNPKAAVGKSMAEFFDNAKTMSDLMDAGLPNYILGPASHLSLAAQGSVEDAGAVAQTVGLPSGAVGLQRTDVATREEILHRDLPKLQKAWDDARAQLKAATDQAGKDAAQQASKAALESAIDYAATQFNLDASRLGVFEHDANGLFKTIAERAKHRASEVLPTFDQPDWMAQKLSDLRQRGYRVVVGSHIGHVYDNTLPSFTKLDGFYTPLRKWAGRVGLDPGRVPDAGVSHAIRANQDALTHKYLTTTPTAVLPTPRADFRTVRAVMQDKTLTRQLPAYARGFLGLTSKIGLNKSEINRIIARTGKTEAEARAELEDAISAQFGPRDLPRKQLVDNLMTSHQVDGPGGAFNWVGVDRKTAEGIVSAYYQGYRLPGYMMGWEAAENWARAGFGIGDKLIQRNPDKPLYQAVNNWPNQLIRARNNLRFTASPVFALRVSAKQRYKAALEGVRIPFNPLQALEKQGATKQANDLLTRLDGSIPHEQLDADRYLMARDVFGIHDSTWDAAYFVHALKQQGKSAAEVKDAYQRVFKYGAQGGRTAAERTVNTIFFPFSFEKTLLRNTGAYLADRPGQALALDLAVEAWRNADKDGKVGKWVEDHMPILQEMQLLNAFSHGISPGQFGGINATILNDVKGGSEALLNLFLPQSWGKDFTKQNLSRYMPVWNQFKTLWSNVAEQQRIAGAAVHDTVRSFVAHDWKPEPVLSQRAQTSAALHTRAKWWTDKNLMAVVDYNNNQQDPADKYLWPQDDRLPVEIWGQPVNKTTLTDYLHYLYPAYDPNQGALYAKDQAAQLSAFIHQISETDPAKAQQMAAFRKIADSIVSHINRDDYDQATTQMAQEQFQQAAPFINSDPQWKALYDNFYAWALGQIQTPAQKAKAVT